MPVPISQPATSNCESGCNKEHEHIIKVGVFRLSLGAQFFSSITSAEPKAQQREFIPKQASRTIASDYRVTSERKKTPKPVQVNKSILRTGIPITDLPTPEIGANTTVIGTEELNQKMKEDDIIKQYWSWKGSEFLQCLHCDWAGSKYIFDNHYMECHANHRIIEENFFDKL